MHHPIDRRTAFSGFAGAALAYGLSSDAEAMAVGQAPGPSAPTTIGGAQSGATWPSVRDKGARGDGSTMDGAAIQDALRAYDTLWVPSGTYLIDVPLVVPSYCVLAFASGAIFCPAHDGMTLFTTGEVSYASRVLAPRIHARGKRDITAFDLQGFRHRAEIQHADIEGCARGIVLRELCWDTVIHMPWIRQTTNPIVISNGSNAVDVIHPGIDDFDIGIRVEPGARYPTTAVRVVGGYVQNGRCGIVDQGAIGTIVEGTYFEGLREADILLSGAIRSGLSRTQHYGETGKVAIQAVGVDGLTVFDPVMSSGARTTGLYDIDGASRNVTRFESYPAAGINQPVGKVGSSGTLVREEGGTFTPVLVRPGGGAVAYEKQEGRWRRAGGQLGISVDLEWSRAQAGGEIVIGGLPAGAKPVGRPVAALAPAVVQGRGATTALARLDGDGNLRLVTVGSGQEVPLIAGTRGAVTVSVTCLF